MCIGAAVAALEYSSGVLATNFGKPSSEYYQSAIAHLKVSPKEILLVSDDPFTDLEGGQKLGFQTAFILTGKYQRDAVAKLSFSPDYVVNNLKELADMTAY